MNCLILNRESFQLPADGWYQLAPLGEFPHAAAGVVQVVDAAACEAMANAFRAEASKPNFAGLLIDFDHFSLDGKQKSEAAGWISEIENRHSGLWGKIRWSDTGEACVRGGRYRFLSPVWAKADCVDLENGRLRPVRLLNAAVTNDPNIKGMVPLSNRAEIGKAESRNGGTYNAADRVEPVPPRMGGKVANGSPAPRFMWVLGDGDRNCPSCAGLAGQVHTMADWDAAGLRPGSGNLFCQGHCKCSLVETEEPEGGSLDGLRVREDVMDKGNGKVANTWSDAARLASIAARKAKAAARRARGREGNQISIDPRPAVPRNPDDGGRREEGGGRVFPVVDPGIPGRPQPEDDIVRVMPVDDVEQDRHYALQEIEGYQDEARSAFRDRYGYPPETPDEIAEAENLAGVPEEYRTRGEMSTEELAEELAARGSDDRLGSGDGDPEFQRLERESMDEARDELLRGQDEAEAVHEIADGLIEREAAGESLTEGEKDFLRRYREIIGDLSDVRGAAVGNRADGPLMANAREAVRRGKAESRKQKAEMGMGERLKTAD